jgi:hypothetical protein
MKTQEVLTCNTDDTSMRSPIQGWTFECPSEVNETFRLSKRDGTDYLSPSDIPVGMIPSGNRYNTLYATVLHALGDGWRLLAPPKEYTETNSEGYPYTVVEWWLVREEA